MKLADIMSKAKKGKPEPMDMGDDDADMAMEPDMDADDESASPEEVDIMKMFERAGSPQEKADALKKFIKVCGGY